MIQLYRKVKSILLPNDSLRYGNDKAFNELREILEGLNKEKHNIDIDIDNKNKAIKLINEELTALENIRQNNKSFNDKICKFFDI
tara:strand:- start:54518 stop:54772 length:255 start_codon:yes stop_codon:yes gene_type:complete